MRFSKRFRSVIQGAPPTVPTAPAGGAPIARTLGSAVKDLTSKFGRMIPRTIKTGMKSGGKVSSASKRADGCAQRGKTRGKII